MVIDAGMCFIFTLSYNVSPGPELEFLSMGKLK